MGRKLWLGAAEQMEKLNESGSQSVDSFNLASQICLPQIATRPFKMSEKRKKEKIAKSIDVWNKKEREKGTISNTHAPRW